MSTLYYETLNQPDCWGVFVYLPEEVLRYVQLRYSTNAPNNRDKYTEVYPETDNTYVIGFNIVGEVLEFARDIEVNVVEVPLSSKTPQEFTSKIREIRNE